MDATVGAAIIGALGVTVGATVSAFAPEIKALLTGRARTNSDLVGKWKCTWFVEHELGEQKSIADIVQVSRVWGEKLWARGVNTEYGDYEITGRVSRSSLVTLHYEGVELRQPLGGVVIMRLNATRNEMNGYWYEYGRKEKINGGPTVWQKAS